MDRRKFFGLSVAAGGLLAAREVAAQSTGPAYNGVPRMEVQPKLRQQQQFRIGYTTNTRGGKVKQRITKFLFYDNDLRSLVEVWFDVFLLQK